MDIQEGNNGHEAVNRLFDMAREGATDSGEFCQLDAMIYDGLLRTYGGPGGSAQVPAPEPAGRGSGVPRPDPAITD